MITSKRLISVATVLAVIVVQLSTAVRTLADDGVPPEETPVASPTDDPAVTAVPSDTAEATPTEELTPTETASDPTEELTPEETAAPAPEETVTPAPDESVTPDPDETVTPDPEETATPEPECVPAADAENSAPQTNGDEATSSENGDGAAPAGEALPVCEETPAGDVTVAYSDPVWCPAGQVPGDAGCTPAFPTITELVAFLQANPTIYYGDGAIYFQTGTYTGPESYIIIDYTLLPQMGTLSVFGGWDLDPAGGYSGNTGTTTFTAPVQVVSDDDVTIADVAVVLPPGSTNAGVFVNTEGDITLDNVTVQGGSSGAELVNSSGTGNVTVTGSTFSNNTNTGLLVYSSGSVTLTDVVASSNNNGIIVDNQSGTASVTLNNIFADENGWTAVDIRSAGDISLTNVTGNNGTVGANLQATDGAGNIFVSGSTFIGNNSVGIRAVTSTGSITLQNVQTDSQNEPGSVGAWLKSYSGGTIAVTGGVFANADTGLFIVGTGDVVLTNVTASGNAGNGATIESGWVFGCFGPDGIAVTVDGGTYQDNGGYGFAVYPGPNGTATLAGTIAFLNNTNGDYNIDLTRSCNPEPEKPAKPYQVVEITGKGDDPAQADCEHYSGIIMILPDQSRVKMTCPVTGDVTVATVAQKDLPGDPPKSVEVIAGLVVVAGDSNLLPEGGSMQMCFKIPPDMEGKHFAILYWDPTANSGVGGWIELPMNQFGGQVFPLHPDTPEDGMRILEGVYQKGDCVCVKVNFTGTFILVAR